MIGAWLSALLGFEVIPPAWRAKRVGHATVSAWIERVVNAAKGAELNPDA